MYGTVLIILLVGIILLIVNIAVIVSIFRISKNISLLTDFFIKGVKPTYNPTDETYYPREYNLYYKLGNDEITHDEWMKQYEDKKKKIDEILIKEGEQYFSQNNKEQD